MWQEPRWDTYMLRSPMARLLTSYRRLLEINRAYLEQEAKIANPVVYLEDQRGNSQESLYQAVTAQNPSWSSSLPGLVLSAKERGDEEGKINAYISNLQQGMVDLINRRSEDPAQDISSVGVRTQKRKRINDVQVPLPANKKAFCIQPSAGRSKVLEFEEFFLKEVPWSCEWSGVLASCFVLLFSFFFIEPLTAYHVCTQNCTQSGSP